MSVESSGSSRAFEPSGLSRLFGSIMQVASKGRKKGNLGEANNFYFHPELKRWVERGKEDEALSALALAPPPVTNHGLGVADTAPKRRSLAQRYKLQDNLSVSSVSSISSLSPVSLALAEGTSCFSNLLPTPLPKSEPSLSFGPGTFFLPTLPNHLPDADSSSSGPPSLSSSGPPSVSSDCGAACSSSASTRTNSLTSLTCSGVGSGFFATLTGSTCPSTDPAEAAGNVNIAAGGSTAGLSVPQTGETEKALGEGYDDRDHCGAPADPVSTLCISKPTQSAAATEVMVAEALVAAPADTVVASPQLVDLGQLPAVTSAGDVGQCATAAAAWPSAGFGMCSPVEASSASSSPTAKEVGEAAAWTSARCSCTEAAAPAPTPATADAARSSRGLAFSTGVSPFAAAATVAAAAAADAAAAAVTEAPPAPLAGVVADAVAQHAGSTVAAAKPPAAPLLSWSSPSSALHSSAAAAATLAATHMNLGNSSAADAFMAATPTDTVSLSLDSLVCLESLRADSAASTVSVSLEPPLLCLPDRVAGVSFNLDTFFPGSAPADTSANIAAAISRASSISLSFSDFAHLEVLEPPPSPPAPPPPPPVAPLLSWQSQPAADAGDASGGQPARSCYGDAPAGAVTSWSLEGSLEVCALGHAGRSESFSFLPVVLLEETEQPPPPPEVGRNFAATSAAAAAGCNGDGTTSAHAIMSSAFTVGGWTAAPTLACVEAPHHRPPPAAPAAAQATPAPLVPAAGATTKGPAGAVDLSAVDAAVAALRQLRGSLLAGAGAGAGGGSLGEGAAGASGVSMLGSSLAQALSGLRCLSLDPAAPVSAASATTSRLESHYASPPCSVASRQSRIAVDSDSHLTSAANKFETRWSCSTGGSDTDLTPAEGEAEAYEERHVPSSAKTKDERGGKDVLIVVSAQEQRWEQEQEQQRVSEEADGVPTPEVSPRHPSARKPAAPPKLPVTAIAAASTMLHSPCQQQAQQQQQLRQPRVGVLARQVVAAVTVRQAAMARRCMATRKERSVLRQQLRQEQAAMADMEAQLQRERAARVELAQQLTQARSERAALLVAEKGAHREEATRGSVAELQAEYDELLLCLGQESAKVALLAEALRSAGGDPDILIGRVEAEYESTASAQESGA